MTIVRRTKIARDLDDFGEFLTTGGEQSGLRARVSFLDIGHAARRQIVSRKSAFRENVAGAACFSLRRVHSIRRHTNFEMAE
jgi:hypothetical protein